MCEGNQGPNLIFDADSGTSQTEAECRDKGAKFAPCPEDALRALLPSRKPPEGSGPHMVGLGS